MSRSPCYNEFTWQVKWLKIFCLVFRRKKNPNFVSFGLKQAKISANGVRKIILTPLVLFGHFWPENFLFWIFKNHSFIGMVRNLVTFMAFGVWTQKNWGLDSSRLSGRKKNSHTCALRSKMTDHRKWMGNRQKHKNSETFCVQSTNRPQCWKKAHSSKAMTL